MDWFLYDNGLRHERVKSWANSLNKVLQGILSSFKEQAFLEAPTRGVYRNLTKFAGKHLCRSVLFNKNEGFSSATLLKRKLWYMFPFEFCEIFKGDYLEEQLLPAAFLVFFKEAPQRHYFSCIFKHCYDILCYF